MVGDTSDNVLYQGYEEEGDVSEEMSADEFKERRRAHDAKIQAQFAAEDRFEALFMAAGVVILAGIGLFALGAWLYVQIPYSYSHKTPLSFAVAFVFTAVTAGVFYYMREVKRKWYLYPPIEVGVSIGLAAAAVGQQNNPIVSLIALFAAVRVAVDGINRFIVYRREARDLRLARLKAKYIETSSGAIAGLL